MNIVPIASTDGLLYCSNVPILSTEADLSDGLVTPSPIQVEYGLGIMAIVKLTINGYVTGNSTFVFLQTDLGDGTWVDVAWLFYNSVQAPATYILCSNPYVASAMAAVVPRKFNSAPATQSTAHASLSLGGRARFTGFSRMTGGSSSAPGVITQITATITYRLVR